MSSDSFDIIINSVCKRSHFEVMMSLDKSADGYMERSSRKLMSEIVYLGLATRRDDQATYGLTDVGRAVVNLMKTYVDSQRNDVILFDPAKVKRFASRVDVESGGEKIKIRDYVNRNSNLSIGYHDSKEIYSRF